MGNRGVAVWIFLIISMLNAQLVLANETLTAVPGIKVGHFTLAEQSTGCTVILSEAGAIAGVDVRGAAPGTRETDLLNPVNGIQQVHAIVLAGGSAFGLDTATGVMRYLDEKGIGFKASSNGHTVNVPIVPAAILMDLGLSGSSKIRPTAEWGYRAASVATTERVAEGNVGAGAGATIGKLGGFKRAMKAGIGSAVIKLSDGLIIGAIVALNALGDVIDPATGQVVAGVRTEDGKKLADARLLLKKGRIEQTQIGGNTTLGVIATNASLTKTQVTKIAQMAHDGYARAIYPVHTLADGDTIFALATGTSKVGIDITRIGALAADVMAQAILRAASQAVGIPGYPSACDLIYPLEIPPYVN